MRKSSDHSKIESDEELLRSYQSTGDQASLGLLYDRYLHLVYGLCLKYLKDRAASQDAVMDIYETLVSKLNQHQVKHFKSWLYMVSKNHCLMQIRKSATEQKKEVIFMESDLVEHLYEERDLEKDLQALEKCIETLKKDQKDCVRMFYLDNKSYEEISNLQKLPLKQVKSYLQNGKRNLKICLESNNV